MQVPGCRMFASNKSLDIMECCSQAAHIFRRVNIRSLSLFARQRLQSPHSRLLIVIGAEAWCTRCRHIRPAFDFAASQALEKDTWLG